MILAYIACFAMAIASAASLRVSRPIAYALALAAISSAFYALLAALYPEAHAAGVFEPQRLVSALVGLVGAWELGQRAHRRIVIARGIRVAEEVASESGLRGHEVWLELLQKGRRRFAIGRTDALAILCLASMASDAAAWLFFRARWPWVGDAETLIFSCMAIVVCRPWRRS